MTDIPPSQTEPSPGNLANEFTMLGKNLKELLQTAWESEERKKLQQEIESGLSQLGKSLTQAVGEFKESPSGQRLRADVDDLHARVRSGEVEAEVREKLAGILRKVNADLEKATPRQTETPPAQTEAPKEG